VRRTADEADGLRRAYLKRESTLLERVERRAAAVADLALVVSDEDAEYYRRLGARIRVVPNGVDCDAYSAIPAGQRVGLPLILYVGSLSWGPNASAARYLVRELLPRVRQTMPDVRARVIGRNPPDDLLALGARSGVEVLADVDRIQPHLREAHVVAVPLDAGGGSRLKILEAFAAGVPVVSTPVGCEGLVAPRERLADAVVRVLRDRPLADRMAIRARDLARRRYDWRAIGADAAQAVAGVVRPAARG
jgi:glycosyltransferase involved in cell wall biosynthesis